jgi:hypothetical protein
MRSKVLVLTAALAVATVVWAAPAHAIAPFLQYQDSKDAGAGYGLGLKHTFLGIVPVVGFDLRASWLHYGDEDKVASSFEMFPLEFAATAKLGLFYGGLGVGYYLTSGDVKPDDEVGGFALGGVGFGLGGLNAFAELRYLLLEPGAADMSGFGAQAGVTLPF